MSMPTVFQYQIPEAFDQALLLLIRQSMAVLERHDEAELLAWARSVEARYFDEAFRERFGKDLKFREAESSSDEDRRPKRKSQSDEPPQSMSWRTMA